MSSPILVRWESRLENWAAWTISGSSQFSAGVSGIYKGLDRYRAEYVGPRPLIGDATDVDALIHRLSDEHRRALVARYVWTGTTQDRARSLGCHVDTLRDRTRAALFRLDDLEQARKRPRCACRARRRIRDIPTYPDRSANRSTAVPRGRAAQKNQARFWR